MKPTYRVIATEDHDGRPARFAVLERVGEQECRVYEGSEYMLAWQVCKALRRWRKRKVRAA